VSTGKTSEPLWVLPDAHVEIAAFSPNDRLIACGGSTYGQVKVWDIAERREVASLHAHKSGVTNLEFSRDGRQLATAGADGIIRLYEVDAVHEIQTLRGHTGAAECVAFSPDGRRIASGGSSGTILVWDTWSGQVLLELNGHTSSICGLEFSPDGQRLASASRDHTIRLWRAESKEGHHEVSGHESNVFNVAFSPDGSLVASHDGHSVRLWNTMTGRLGTTLNPNEMLLGGLGFNADGSRLFVVCGDRIRSWAVASGTELSEWRRPLEWEELKNRRISGFDVGSEGRLLAFGTRDGPIHLWDANAGVAIGSLRHRDGWVGRLRLSPDGKLLAVTGDKDCTVTVLDLQGRVVFTWKFDALVFDLDFTRDSAWIAAGLQDGLIKVWDVATGRPVARLKGHVSCVSQVVFQPGRTHLVSAGYDGTVRLWDIGSGKEVRILGRHTGHVYSLDIAPDGRRIVSGGSDGLVKFWWIDDEGMPK
jgi:WD40 repeat protein